MQITRISPISHTQRTVHMDITQDQLRAWRGGRPFTKAFPRLTDPERLFFLTGITTEELDSSGLKEIIIALATLNNQA